MVSLHVRGRWVLMFGLLGCGPKTETAAPVVEKQVEAPEAAAAGADEPTMIVKIPANTMQAYRWYVATPPEKLPPGEPGVAIALGEPIQKDRHGDLGLFAGGWVLDFTDLGYTVVGEHRGWNSWSTWLVHPSGPRVMLDMIDTGERLEAYAWAVTKPVAPPSLPGPCVPVPEVAFQIGTKVGDGTLNQTFTTRHDLDLDGDGALDADVPLAKDARCADDVRHALYVTRGACGHRVGTVGPGTIAVHEVARASPTAAGLKPVRTWTHRSGAGKWIHGERNFAFDGGAYREVAAKDREEACETCKPSECSGPQPIP